MGNKIQGEGDYEAGRRFQEEEHEFVKRKYGKRKENNEVDLDAKLNDIDDDDDTQITDNSELNRSQRMDNDSAQQRR